jgi:hypothetical protein
MDQLPVPREKRTSLPALLVVLVAAIVGSVVYLYYAQYLVPPEEPAPLEVVKEQKADWSYLEGKIYLSLAPIAEENSTISVYEYDFATEELKNLSEDSQGYMAYKNSHDARSVAFTLVEEDKAVLYAALLEAESKPWKVSDDTMKLARDPSWSFDDTRIAFAARTEDINAGSMDVESWNVYVADATEGSKPTLVTMGSSPLFLADDSILVLKKSGLFRYIEDADGTWTGIPAFYLKDGFIGEPNMKLTVSSDGTHVAWSDVDTGLLYVFTVTLPDGSQDFRLDLAAGFESAGFWPVFSPDNRYLALLISVLSYLILRHLKRKSSLI